MNQDINLFYSGGSGGFFCLHLLLLTEYFYCIFDNDKHDFEEIFQNQWNIKSIPTWKTSEIWPNNSATAKSNITRKIYFTCNKERDWEQFPGTKIVLYTDIETQCFLAKTKRANWFVNRTDKQFTETYNNIRGYNWPDCNSIKEFDNLPQHIKDECINNFYFFPPTDLKVNPMLNNSLYYNEDKVYADLIKNQVFSRADIVVKLQDLIKTKGEVLFNQLGIKGNSKSEEFVEQWLTKHTEEQLRYLLK
jgi:hypothetical protein